MGERRKPGEGRTGSAFSSSRFGVTTPKQNGVHSFDGVPCAEEDAQTDTAVVELALRNGDAHAERETAQRDRLQVSETSCEMNHAPQKGSPESLTLGIRGWGENDSSNHNPVRIV